MNISQAIEKAVEGGFRAGLLTDEQHPGEPFPYEVAFLSPLFWQSLGKAMGWGGMGFDEDEGKEVWCDALRCPKCGEWLTGDRLECSEEHEYDGSDVQTEWLYQWHRFIDHLAEGKDAESYFESL